MRMIAEVDPEQLMLGKGISDPKHMTHASHQAPMEFFHEMVQQMLSSRGKVEDF